MSSLTLNYATRMFNVLKQTIRLEKLGGQMMVHSSGISHNQVTQSPDPNIQVYGQPTARTHPHLMQPGELVPGLSLQEFKDRRKNLANLILSDGYAGKEPNHIVIIPSSAIVYMTDKIPYVFRQNTDFLYFTGCQEPDSVLVLTANSEKTNTTLFVQKKDPRAELWDGPRTGPDAAREMFGVDRALPTTEFDRFLSSALAEQKSGIVWYDNNELTQPELHKKLQHCLKSSSRSCVSPKAVFHAIRLRKSEAEVRLMQKSCEIASAAIARTIETSQPGMSEHQIFATVDYECRMRGAEFLAYPPVVAAGNNANTVHYIANKQIVQPGDMVLMDAGCEYHGYTSDITRTWPISGSFTPQQRELYEVVLDVQKTLIPKLAELPTLDEVFSDMCKLLGQRLQEIGLVPKSYSGDQLTSAAFGYCPHHVSHYLGMDVHDSGKISRHIRTMPGMIVTIEPGVYVNARNSLAPREFHGLGIRIEDDILLREDGPQVLTSSCPKELSEIESLAKKNVV